MSVDQDENGDAEDVEDEEVDEEEEEEDVQRVRLVCQISLFRLLVRVDANRMFSSLAQHPLLPHLNFSMRATLWGTL
jgi:hypothetical protein